MFNIVKKTMQWGDGVLELEVGKIARQATASVVAKMGNTVVLCTVVARKEAKEGMNFFPLTVNYLEKFYAIGKVPGGFLKRENRPSERETLISRLIDRPIRPMFPEGFFNEVQVMCTVLSYDPKYQSDIIAMIGASAALEISGIPFEAPIAAARVGYISGEFVLNPSDENIKEGSDLDLIVAGTSDSVLMVESDAQELSEEQMLEGVMFGHNALQDVINMIKDLASEAGKEKWDLQIPDNQELKTAISNAVLKDLESAYSITDKQERREKISQVKDSVVSQFIDEQENDENIVTSIFKDLEKEVVRNRILEHRQRIDGRSEDEVRQIESETNLIPNAHGSALFTRGETQALVVTTLGTGDDEQIIDDIEGDRKERFLLHYNFPPYSVGESAPLRAPGRREIGHGKLAWRACKSLIPSKEEFPYTIRVVSEVTESNGSSSMATVCGTSMSLMSAGVPFKKPVAGIAMGLIKEGDKFSVLSDIMGDEDHLGDMDFKVAGTQDGITALQMDIKISGISAEIISKALDQAKEGRLHILSRMSDAIYESSGDVHENAPRIVTLKIDKNKIGELIGPGGKMIKSICEKTEAKIDIEDDGTVRVSSNNADGMNAAVQMVKDVTFVPEVGSIYKGTIIKILDFGAVIQYSGKAEGMLHISQITEHRIDNVSDILNEGDVVNVKLVSLDPRTGKVRLSMKDIEQDGIDMSAVGKASPKSSDQSDDSDDSDLSSDDHDKKSDSVFQKRRHSKNKNSEGKSFKRRSASSSDKKPSGSGGKKVPRRY